MRWLQGIMGAGLASSLAGNRILNGCLLAPSQTHTHIPPRVFSPCPHSDSSHTLYYSELHQSSSGVCVCAPRGHAMDRLDDFVGLELHKSLLFLPRWLELLEMEARVTEMLQFRLFVSTASLKSRENHQGGGSKAQTPLL